MTQNNLILMSLVFLVEAMPITARKINKICGFTNKRYNVINKMGCGFMCEISGIKNIVNDVINAIHSVINVEVTVINKNGERVAATGKYNKEIGSIVAEGSAFSLAIKTGKSFVIEDPRVSEICTDCNRRDVCEEFAEVCTPIIVENEVLGIIGLIAFDREQRDSLLSNKRNLLNFLDRMAELIGTKVLEERQRKSLERNSKEISILMDYLDEAVISIDKEGKIKKYNSNADQIFGMIKNGYSTIYDIHCMEEANLILNTQSSFVGRETVTKNDRIETRVVYSGKPIITDQIVEEVILTYRRSKDLLSVMDEMIGVKVKTSFEDIIGKNKEFIELKAFSKKAARTNSTIMIRGESGTGKELFARAVHFESPRRNRPFVPINCAAIPENLLESELFGYEDGAFTGAKKGGQIGKFELANKGTLFLDEIGDMSLHLQAKLLRVLQENVIERIGGNQYIPIDIRVVAATHRDIDKMIEDGEFREDLYYRLNVIPVNIASLRQRPDDIMILSDYFIKKYNHIFAKIKDNIITGLSEDVVEKFYNYCWPGNIRELENAMEFAVNICESALIQLEDLPNKFKTQDPSQGVISNLSEMEKNEIEKGICIYGKKKEGIQIITEKLGISRATLYRKMKEFGL